MPSQVLDFWFNELDSRFWFAQSDEVDALIRSRFGELTQRAAQGELAHWRADIRGRLAEIIVLDQFSRNIWRGSPQAFSQDGMALVLAQEALNQPDFKALNAKERHFLLLPFMHSESAVIHQQALALFEAYTNPQVVEFELKHKDIIDRFGRYPHRNAILGRSSSAEERDFLQTHSGF